MTRKYLAHALLGSIVLAATATAASISPMGFDEVAVLPGATLVRFDDYVSNPSPGGAIVNNTVLLSTPGVFTGFINPLSTNTSNAVVPDPVGILVESSYGEVMFMDATSFQVTSDIVGPWTAGATLSITFVDPSNPMQKATVQDVAFRFGSVISNDAVSVELFDADMNQINVTHPAYNMAPAGLKASRGWRATEDQEGKSLIHMVQFTTTAANGHDGWLLGSFVDSEASQDMAFTGFQLVSEQLLAVPIPTVPIPPAAWLGLSLLGSMGTVHAIRRKQLYTT